LDRRPSAAVGALFVIALTLLLFLLNGDAKVLTWISSDLGQYVSFIQQMLAYVVLLGFGTVALRAEGITRKDLGFSRNNLYLALPVLLGFILGNYALVELGGGWSKVFAAGDPPLPYGLIILGTILVAFTEEYIFRGYVQIGTKKRFGVTASLIVSAMVFSLAHIPTDLSGVNPAVLGTEIPRLAVSIVSRFAFGILAFSYMYQFTGNMFITLFTHAFYDFSVGYLAPVGGTLTIILLYMLMPFAIVLAVYYAPPFRRLLQKPSGALSPPPT
jgi:membrane protease YdiL (CAAX protease family)